MTVYLTSFLILYLPLFCFLISTNNNYEYWKWLPDLTVIIIGLIGMINIMKIPKVLIFLLIPVFLFLLNFYTNGSNNVGGASLIRLCCASFFIYFIIYNFDIFNIRKLIHHFLHYLSLLIIFILIEIVLIKTKSHHFILDFVGKYKLLTKNYYLTNESVIKIPQSLFLEFQASAQICGLFIITYFHLRSDLSKNLTRLYFDTILLMSFAILMIYPNLTVNICLMGVMLYYIWLQKTRFTIIILLIMVILPCLWILKFGIGYKEAYFNSFYAPIEYLLTLSPYDFMLGVGEGFRSSVRWMKGDFTLGILMVEFGFIGCIVIYSIIIFGGKSQRKLNTITKLTDQSTYIYLVILFMFGTLIHYAVSLQTPGLFIFATFIAINWLFSLDKAKHK